MYQIAHGTTNNLADVEDFVKMLESNQIVTDLFDNKKVFVTRAPGRLDVMGGIADYSGSLTLEMPIAEAAFCALQMQDLSQVEIVSLNTEENKRTNHCSIALADFEKDGKPIEYAEAFQIFRRDEKQSWAAYIAGAFLVLKREKGVNFANGARILIDSKVPEGKGVSSSAAIEVAAMSAIIAAYEIEIEPRELAILCQKVENLVVGAPCGVMDQMSSACGKSNQLLALLCQPAELLGTQKVPDELAVWGIDSGIRHSVGGGDYGSVRTGAFMGYRMIADLVGLKVNKTAIEGVVNIEDERWKGYLANINQGEFEKNFAENLPIEMSGAEFLERYQGISDTVTQVLPDKIYAVLKPTAHPIYESFRVRYFALLLLKSTTEDNLKTLGSLMYESHESYSACGLGSDGTDLLVKLVKCSKNLYGAKITGGGSGGTVAVLGRKGADAEIAEIAEKYQKQTGHQPYIFSGSSMGAAEFGFLKLEKI